MWLQCPDYIIHGYILHFPKKNTAMCLSGSFTVFFAVFPSVWLQCSVTKNFPSGTFWMSPSFQSQWSQLGIFLGKSRNTANSFQGNWKTGNILGVFAVFLDFPKNIPSWDHCDWNDGDIQNVPLGKFLVTSFRLILNFTDSEHCNQTDGNTAKNTVNEPLRNITGTFFEKIQDIPTTFLFRTSQSHDLVHCECTWDTIRNWQTAWGELRQHSSQRHSSLQFADRRILITRAAINMSAGEHSSELTNQRGEDKSCGEEEEESRIDKETPSQWGLE